MAQFSFIPSAEISDVAEDVREIFDELASTLKNDQRAYSGECHPALDVFETDDAVEIMMDVSGISAEAFRVVFRAGVLLIAGEKAPPIARAPRTFHLVEREFGRFARGVRLNGASLDRLWLAKEPIAQRSFKFRSNFFQHWRLTGPRLPVFHCRHRVCFNRRR